MTLELPVRVSRLIELRPLPFSECRQLAGIANKRHITFRAERSAFVISRLSHGAFDTGAPIGSTTEPSPGSRAAFPAIATTDLPEPSRAMAHAWHTARKNLSHPPESNRRPADYESLPAGPQRTKRERREQEIQQIRASVLRRVQ
jgi:hypothetical protein